MSQRLACYAVGIALGFGINVVLFDVRTALIAAAMLSAFAVGRWRGERASNGIRARVLREAADMVVIWNCTGNLEDGPCLAGDDAVRLLNEAADRAERGES